MRLASGNIHSGTEIRTSATSDIMTMFRGTAFYGTTTVKFLYTRIQPETILYINIISEGKRIKPKLSIYLCLDVYIYVSVIVS